jgi:GTP pyrophosphokinase
MELIFESQKYIEQHLEEKLSVSVIAEVFGYSEYHFSRMFSEYVGMSVMEYVKRRRLMKAAEDILGGMKIIDAAVKSSYESHSGFTKAFKKEFGYSPSLLGTIQMQLNELKGGNHMSKLFLKQIDEMESKENLYGILLECLDKNQIAYDVNNIKRAYEFSTKAYDGLYRHSGTEYITHPLNVAIILADVGANESTIIAGLMCDILTKTYICIKELEKNFPTQVIDIMKGIADFDEKSPWEQEDIVMVKLAERLHNMRTLKFMDESRWKEKAVETIEAFIPLARKLGNNALMEEMNKLAIEYA